MDSMDDLTAGLLNLALVITVVGAGATAALAFVMGVITAARALGRTDQERSLKSAAVMFLIVSADCFVLWALSDFWGNDEPLAAFLAAVGFGFLALTLSCISREHQQAREDPLPDQTETDEDRAESSQEDEDV